MLSWNVRKLDRVIRCNHKMILVVGRYFGWCPKVEGMILLVRIEAPQVIAVDEIGSMEDVDAMEYAANSGVKLLATVHGASMDEIKRKPGIERLIKHRFFERYVLLGDGIGNVKAIFDDRGSTIM